MITRGTWDEFRNAGLLWWANRTLHLFGWAIVVNVDDDGNVTEAYPARCRFRGFDAKSETAGFRRVTNHMHGEMDRIMEEVYDDEQNEGDVS